MPALHASQVFCDVRLLEIQADSNWSLANALALSHLWPSTWVLSTHCCNPLLTEWGKEQRTLGCGLPHPPDSPLCFWLPLRSQQSQTNYERQFCP